MSSWIHGAQANDGLACRDATAATTLLVLMTIEWVKPRKTTAIRKSPALTMQDVS
jgi:hypothetical protein